MNRQCCSSLIALGVATLFLTTGIARAQFTFTNIADTTTATPAGGTYTGFDVAPSINGNTAAFVGNYSGGTGIRGVFTGSGGALTAIATAGPGTSAQVPGGGTFGTFRSSSARISGSNVAFVGSTTGTGVGGAYRGSGGALTTIATAKPGSNASPAGGTFSDIFDLTGISGNTVAFTGNYTGGAGTIGIFSGSGGALTTIVTGGTGASAQAPGGGTFSGFGPNSASISGNTVAFSGSYTGGTGTFGIFTGSGGALTTIATDATATPVGGTFTGFVSPVSLSGNSVSFLGLYTGGLGSAGVFMGSGGALTAIATDTTASPAGGVFTGFGMSSIDGNNVAFDAAYTGGVGTHGIFIKTGGGISKVITNGDTLFGSAVTALGFGNSALSGTNLSFQYTLADGRKGVAVASLASGSGPEPGTLAFLALGGILPFVAKRRRA